MGAWWRFIFPQDIIAMITSSSSQQAPAMRDITVLKSQLHRNQKVEFVQWDFTVQKDPSHHNLVVQDFIPKE